MQTLKSLLITVFSKSAPRVEEQARSLIAPWSIITSRRTDCDSEAVRWASSNCGISQSRMQCPPARALFRSVLRVNIWGDSVKIFLSSPKGPHPKLKHQDRYVCRGREGKYPCIMRLGDSERRATEPVWTKNCIVYKIKGNGQSGVEGLSLLLLLCSQL
jgi:hypothetical protein